MTKLCGKIMKFAADREGAVLPYATLVIFVLFGLAMLGVDLSRYFDLQTQLQKAADAFALAGAAELDGRPDAETRAQNAINALMANYNYNSSGFGNPNPVPVTAQAINFYSQLPATDDLGMGSATPAATPAAARFVQVVVAPVSMTALIPAALFGAAGTVQTQASAVAGFTQALCRQPPIFVCNDPGGANDMMNPDAMRGHEVSLVAPPGNAYAPGNYGFLDIGCGNNTPCLNQALGGNNGSGTCINLDPVTTTTGQKTASGAYFNTRFDLYQNDAKNADPAKYSPDVNVRKGYTAPADCNNPNWKSDGGWGGPSTHELPMPDDSNISPPYSTATIGNGNWQGNFDTYWSVNFPGVPKPPTPATRFALYQYEITKNLVSKPACGTNCSKPNGEVGTPVCQPKNAQACDFTDPNRLDTCRRIIYAAVLDCSQLGGGQQKATPMGVVTFFLLQPTIATGKDTQAFGPMLGEYVDLAKANDASGILHDIVQLYR